MDNEYKARSGRLYCSVRRRIVRSAADTMRLLQSSTVNVAANVYSCRASQEVFATTSDDSSLPEYARMDFQPISDADVGNDDVNDDDDDDDDGEVSLHSYGDECYVSSDYDDDAQYDFEKPALGVQLAQWAVRYNVTDTALGQFLSILKPHHSDLPIDPRTLKKTPTTHTT